MEFQKKRGIIHVNKISFVFPGQGSQYVGMGKQLYEEHAEARNAFEEASESIGFDLAKLCFEGKPSELTLTANAQPAILTASVAAYRVWQKEVQMKPAFMAGHSLGEITALACAGAIRFEDAVRIVRKRGQFMQEAMSQGSGAMAAISGMTAENIQLACEQQLGSVVISNFNAPDQTVISGDRSAVLELCDKLGKQGAICIPLQVSAPFHSPFMKPAALQLAEELNAYSYSPLNYPVISNVTAAPYANEGQIQPLLTEQMTAAVRWVESIRYLTAQGSDCFIEIGPKFVLKNVISKIDSSVAAYALDQAEDRLSCKANWTNGLAAPAPASLDGVDRQAALTFIQRCLAIAVCTRNRNDNAEQYDEGVVKPYKQVMELYLQLEQASHPASSDDISAAADMLDSIFRTKGTPEAERLERIEQLRLETGFDKLYFTAGRIFQVAEELTIG